MNKNGFLRRLAGRVLFFPLSLTLIVPLVFVFLEGCQSVKSPQKVFVPYPEDAVAEYMLQEEIINKLNFHKEFSFAIQESKKGDVTYVSKGVNPEGENLTLYVIHFFISREDASKMYHSMLESKMPSFEYGALVVFLPEGDRNNIAGKLAKILKGMGFKIV